MRRPDPNASVGSFLRIRLMNAYDHFHSFLHLIGGIRNDKVGVVHPCHHLDLNSVVSPEFDFLKMDLLAFLHDGDLRPFCSHHERAGRVDQIPNSIIQPMPTVPARRRKLNSYCMFSCLSVTHASQ